jgi:hypothetical protein
MADANDKALRRDEELAMKHALLDVQVDISKLSPEDGSLQVAFYNTFMVEQKSRDEEAAAAAAGLAIGAQGAMRAIITARVRSVEDHSIDPSRPSFNDVNNSTLLQLRKEHDVHHMLAAVNRIYNALETKHNLDEGVFRDLLHKEMDKPGTALKLAQSFCVEGATQVEPCNLSAAPARPPDHQSSKKQR